MAHSAQYEYVSRVRDKFPDRFKNCKVVDCGSCDINGNNRWAFEDFKYLGIDVGSGPNVDIVSPIHKVRLKEPADVAISTECLEHDMHYKESIQNMYDMIKPGGLLLITCATTGRGEHGTLRTSPGCSNTSQVEGEWSNYYKNLTEEDFRECLDFDESFSEYEFEVNAAACDIYFWGIKNGTSEDN